MTAPTTPSTRIVVVSGNEYQVPLTATEAELRTHLAGNFPDIANATLQKKHRDIEGVTYEVWEFVKRAGTKGATGAEIAALLAATPPLPTAPLSASEHRLMERLRESLRGSSYWHPAPKDRLTIGEALDGNLRTIVAKLPASGSTYTGGSLCSLLDTLPAVPGSDTSGW